MRNTIAMLLAGLSAQLAHAQNFVNLDFEAANLPAIPRGQFGSYVSVADALPGWSAYLGSQEVGNVLQNNATLGGANISIFTPEWPASGIIEGRNTVLLQAGSSAPTFVNVSISQFGLVPVGTVSIFLKASGNNFFASLSGQEIPLIPIAFESNYTLYGGNVSQFSGLSGELTLSSLTSPERPFNNVSFDSVSFSPASVPEPSAWALFGLAGLLMGIWRWLFRCAK